MRATSACGLLLGLAVLLGCQQDGRTSARVPTESLTLEEQTALRERAFALLEELTSHDAALIRANACEALIDYPARVSPVARRLIDDPNEGVRAIALVAAGRAGLTIVTRAKAPPAERDESSYVRASAAFALAANDLPTNRRGLAEALLADPSPLVRGHAALLMGLLGEPSAAGPLREAAALSLPRASEREVAILRLQIAEALVRLGDDEQLQVLRAALYPSRPEELETTALAASSMGEVGDRGSIDELIYLIERTDGAGNPLPAEVRLAAARSLAKLGLPEGAEFGLEFLEDEDPRVRSLAAAVVAEGRSPALAMALEPLLEDASPVVRVAAASGIVRLLTTDPRG